MNTTPFRRALAVVVMGTGLFFFDLPLATLASEQRQIRTWRDSSGRFSVEGKLLQTNATHVQLQTTDGRRIAVPIGRLSEADQKYLASLTTPAEPEDLNDLFDFSTEKYGEGARRNADGSWPHVGPIPNRTIDESKVTYFVSLGGDDAKDGRTRQTAFRTMQRAADVVEAGDTVLVSRGVYKHGFHLAKRGRPDAWITFVAEPGVVIKGSDVRRDWKREPGELPIYSIERPKLLSSLQQPNTPLRLRLEQVFVEEHLLVHVSQREGLRPRDVFYVDDSAKKLYVCLRDGRNPNEMQTDVSMRTWAIAIGGPPNTNLWDTESFGEKNAASYIRIDSFAVRNIANFSRMAAIQVRGICDHILIENCDVKGVNYYGLAAGSMVFFSKQENQWIRHLCHDVVVRNCIASNNGATGITSGGVSNARFEYNLMDNNNYKRDPTAAEEGGGIKTGFDAANIVLQGNVARNNHGPGLWIDSGREHCLIQDNLVFNSIGAGFQNEVTPLPPRDRPGFYWSWEKPDAFKRLSVEEIQQWAPVGTITRRNVVVSTRLPRGIGVYVSSSCNSQVYDNVMYGNAGYGMEFGGSGSRGDTNGLSGNRASKNVFVENRVHVGYAVDNLTIRLFDNQVGPNLYGRHWHEMPFLIWGQGPGAQPVGFEKWRQIQTNDQNVITEAVVFRDPDRFDFTLREATLGERVDFDGRKMRLDWSEFLVAPTSHETVPAIVGTGGPSSSGGDRIFWAEFEGHVDATGSAQSEIQAGGYTRSAFNGGHFVKGVSGLALVPSRALTYPVPEDFPLDGQATLIMCLKADDWTAPKRQETMRKSAASRVMVPFNAAGSEEKQSGYWETRFEIDQDNLRSISLCVRTCGWGPEMDVTKWVEPDRWFQLLVTWGPDPRQPRSTLCRAFVNGEFVGEETNKQGIDQIGKTLRVGVPSNPANPWLGAIDDVAVHRKGMTEREVKQLAAEFIQARDELDGNR